MAKEFLTNCFTITTRTKSEFIKENSNLDKEIYGSFQDFIDDLYEFCADYDLRTDVESVNSNNTEFEIDFYADYPQDNEDVDFDNYVGTMFVDISISRNLEDYISVRPF